MGDDEASDPEHLAGSLVDLVAATPGQEVASHTFSHFYCLEAGQHEEDLRADLARGPGHRRRARSAAHQPGPAAQPVEPPVCRGGEGERLQLLPWTPATHGATRPDRVAARDRSTGRPGWWTPTEGLAPPPTFAWDAILQEDGLCDVPASAFLRPYAPGRRRLEPLRLHRLVTGLRHAARRGRVFHLWWHPHNFAAHPEESFAFLNQLLDEYDRLAEREGMQSLSMRDVASALIAPGQPAARDDATIDGQILGDNQL